MKEKNYVFYLSMLLTGGIAIWAVALNDSFVYVSNAVYNFLTIKFGWLYLLAMLLFVIFIISIAFSKYGKLRLGDDDSRPEYKTSSWFAMLFGAGMGVGLVFWGISEPLSHYINPMGMEGGTAEAAYFAIKSSFLHWGIHPWANYSIIGLALAYFQFRKKKPALISSIFEPLIGEKGVNGALGKTIDVFAVFATVAGVTTSLGLGVLQINSGLEYMFGIPSTLLIQIIIISVITVVYIWTAVAGIEKGIKIISDVNLYIAFILMALAMVVGPKVEILNNFTNGLGQYICNIIPDSLMLVVYGDNSWIQDWRIFYWAWWIAWAPFVGVFIARISKGRTIREFIAGVVLAPSVGSIVWFAIFGTLGIHLGEEGILSIEALEKVAAVPETGLFTVLEKYPMGIVLSAAALVLVCTFFITSANSGTFVLSMLTSNGNLNPPNSKKVLWGIVQSLMAIGLLIAGGLKPLQIISIAAAFPFIFVMLAACVSLLKALKSEHV
ncbi:MULTISPECIES: glycine betaine uptake BCCT transporter [unclassified Sedimentibacter]|uniref:glycine betaine uptake BCCT transporter n=1 Tax=unclassified Sedimentibacter TaxID=2649220 RepID=UPI0027E15E6E|nr:BCCT family transporter [Sedimentibacter sp. MB35-C1]WMJ78982.1 BCCT family transporter [Sedimentibacter sp. MB35-C1]